MLIEAKGLRWLGIDMQSRERRRIAIVATYAAFLIVVWVHPRRTFEILTVLFMAWAISSAWSIVGDGVAIWTRRLLAAIALTAAAVYIWKAPSAASNNYVVMAATLYATHLLFLGSVLGWAKLVEPSGRGWMAHAINEGKPLSRRMQRRLTRLGFAVGLEGFAWYEYGLHYKSLTTEQKLEIEQLNAANPKGKWMRNRERVLFDDERLRHADDRVRARVQRAMSAVIGLSVLGWYWGQVFDWQVSNEIAGAYLWTLAALSMTLRQAIVLWTEPDPRATVDELELVQPQEA